MVVVKVRASIGAMCEKVFFTYEKRQKKRPGRTWGRVQITVGGGGMATPGDVEWRERSGRKKRINKERSKCVAREVKHYCKRGHQKKEN